MKFTKKRKKTMTTKEETITIPGLTVKKTSRVLMSPVRLPAELVAEASELMNAYNITPTEFTENAWRHYTALIKRRERKALKELKRMTDPEAFEQWCIENNIEPEQRKKLYQFVKQHAPK